MRISNAKFFNFKNEKLALSELNNQFIDYISKLNKKKVHISLCGGNTPKSFYRSLKGNPILDKTCLWLGDERWVPLDDPERNERMMRETLGEDLEDKLMSWGNPDLISHEQAARGYEQQLLSFFAGDSSGDIWFDLILLGVGEDGHIASLFPGQDALWKDDSYTVATFSSAGQERLSFTYPALYRSEEIWILTAGKNKKELLSNIQPHHPLSLLKNIGKIKIFNWL